MKQHGRTDLKDHCYFSLKNYNEMKIKSISFKGMGYNLKILLSAILLSSCSSKLTNLDFVKEEIALYYESGEYNNEVNEIISESLNDFESATFDDSAVVIFDVDETALSNYEITKETDFGYVPELWDKWIEDVKAPAIPGVKKLYDYLIEKGSRVIFITGRKDYQYQFTFNNLIKEGYIKFDTLIVRKENEYILGAVEFKSRKREELTSAGYKIAGTVGDQWSDLEGSFHGIQVKIPNYLYYIE